MERIKDFLSIVAYRSNHD